MISRASPGGIAGRRRSRRRTGRSGRCPFPRPESCCTTRRCAWEDLRPWGPPGLVSRGVILVGVHATAGGVDDQDALGSRGGDRLIHGGGELAHPAGRPAAPVLVPHVADDDGGLGGVPAEDFLLRFRSSSASSPLQVRRASRTRACRISGSVEDAGCSRRVGGESPAARATAQRHRAHSASPGCAHRFEPPSRGPR